VISSEKGENSVRTPFVNDNFITDEVIDSVEEGSTGAIGSGSTGRLLSTIDLNADQTDEEA
jgi:hypothetical protein